MVKQNWCGMQDQLHPLNPMTITSATQRNRDGGLPIWRRRYLCLSGILWAVVSGPFSGFLAACSYAQNGIEFEMNTAVTFVFFVSCVLLTALPNYRWVARLWTICGVICILCSWYKYFNRDWEDDLENWKDISMVVTILFAATAFLPSFCSDPCVTGLMNTRYLGDEGQAYSLPVTIN